MDLKIAFNEPVIEFQHTKIELYSIIKEEFISPIY